MQPTWIPPNCRFVIEDAQLDWKWPYNYFDFVHVRHLTGCINDWTKLYSQIYSHLKPGGYFQHCDYDIVTRSDVGVITPDHIYSRWNRILVDASAANGSSFDLPARGNKMETMMVDAGFVDVVHQSWKVPIGAWPRDRKMKQIGLFTFEFLDHSLEGFALFLLREVMGWEYEAIQELVAAMRHGLRKSRLMPYFVL
jgi:SAM-dependent methyltransferase